MARNTKAVTGGVCRKCGCTETTACWHDKLGPCWWVEADLCSHCAQTPPLVDVERFNDPEQVAMREGR